MEHTIIIAEAGVNHNGNIDLARKLIDAAAESGADYVKFQTFKAEKLVAANAPKAEYQVKNSKDKSETGQYEMLKKLELKDADFIELKEYASGKNIGFISTPFDLESIDFLEQLNLDFYKIGSGDLTNKPLLSRIGALGRNVILSTGMSDLVEIHEAVEVLIKSGLSMGQITVLQCNTEYPTPPIDVNIKAMLTIQKEIGTKVGYSDHAIGPEYAIAAVAMGAKVIEKHLTLDKSLDGPDHAASANANEFRQMVSMIRNVELALGNGIKQPSESEKKNMAVARKSIHLSKSISKGTVITEGDLIMKRPGTGISPMLIQQVIGKRTTSNLEKDHLLKPEDLD